MTTETRLCHPTDSLIQQILNKTAQNSSVYSEYYEDWADHDTFVQVVHPK